MNKVAILILAHTNFSQLELFINQFNSNYFDIFIHIDKKATIPQDFFDFVSKAAHIVVLGDEERISTNWGDISLIEAELKLIKKAIKTDNPYSFYILCSGQDLLIKKSSDLFTFLAKHSEENFNNIVTSSRAFEKRVQIKYAKFMMSKKLSAKLFRFAIKIITGGTNHTIPLFVRKFYTEHQFTWGSQWFCYNHETILFILDYLFKNPLYLKECSNCLVPDEFFFQTIVGENPNLAKSVHEGLTFFDFPDGRASPRVFALSDYNLIHNSGKFFARKFDILKDRKIITKILNETKE